MIRAFIVSMLLLYFPCSLYSQDDEETESAVFKVYNAQAQIDSVSTGAIFWKDLVKAGKIELEGCANCEITKFDLRITAYTIHNSDSCSVEPELSGKFHSDSAQFSAQMMKAISKAKQGKFTFYNISATTPSGQQLDMNQIILSVYPTRDYYKKRLVTYKD